MSDTKPAPPSHPSADTKALWRQLASTYEWEPHELKLLRVAVEALDRATEAGCGRTKSEVQVGREHSCRR